MLEKAILDRGMIGMKSNMIAFNQPDRPGVIAFDRPLTGKYPLLSIRGRTYALKARQGGRSIWAWRGHDSMMLERVSDTEFHLLRWETDLPRPLRIEFDDSSGGYASGPDISRRLETHEIITAMTRKSADILPLKVKPRPKETVHLTRKNLERRYGKLDGEGGHDIPALLQDLACELIERRIACPLAGYRHSIIAELKTICRFLFDCGASSGMPIEMPRDCPDYLQGRTFELFDEAGISAATDRIGTVIGSDLSGALSQRSEELAEAEVLRTRVDAVSTGLLYAHQLGVFYIKAGEGAKSLLQHRISHVP